MLWWQIFALGAACAIAARVALLLRQGRRRQQLVLALLLVTPWAGFTVFAAVPGPPPELTWVTVASTLLLVLGLFPAFNGRRALQRWRFEAVTQRYLTFANRHVLAARALLVLGLSGYVFTFEPWFGISNLGLVALWTVIWIPTRWRVVNYALSVEIAAPPEVTFQFLVDSSKWNRYVSELDSVTVEPAGQLAVGSVVTTLEKFPTGLKKPGWESGTLKSRSRIAAITDHSFTSVALDGIGVAATDVQPIKAKTLLIVRGHGLLPFTDALLGLALDMPKAVADRRAKSLQGFDRLNKAVAEGT